MKIIIIGAGAVGFDLSQMLAMDKHDVTLIDKSANRLAYVREKLDVLTVEGTGTSGSLLREVGIESADLVIAVTDVDEVNIITCMLAGRLGSNATTIARVRSDEFMDERHGLSPADIGLDLMIRPEESAAEQIVRLIRRASATDLLTFADGELQLLGIRIDREGPVEKTMYELSVAHPDVPFRVMAVQRNVATLIPRGETRLRMNDHVFILARSEDMPKVVHVFGKSEKRIQKIMILGGNPIAVKVAAELSKEKTSRRNRKMIKLIEPDRRRAEMIADQLANVLVIHGAPSDIDLLTIEGIGQMDAILAVTEDEELNLVTCLMAKHMKVPKTVALLSKTAYIPLSQTIGLDSAVNPKFAVSREILGFIRGRNVTSVATIHGLDAEVLEIKAGEKAPITKRPLSGLMIPRGILIGAIINESGAHVASGDTQIQANDRVILFALPHLVQEVEYYFEGAK